MRFWKLSLVSASVLVLAAACKSEPTAQPTPEASASAASSVKNPKLSNVAPQPRVDPMVMKTYRNDACFYGTLSLKQAKAAYTKSLGASEPGPGKIPDFAIDLNPPEPATKGAPAGSGSAAKVAPPPPPPKPTMAPSAAAPAKSAAPAGSAVASPLDQAKRIRAVPYERFARSCTVAAGLKNPPAADLDAAVGEFAPFAVQLAKDLAAASTYYQKEEYKTDSFAKGKEFHTKIMDGFKKLDELHAKFGTALDAFKKANPPDVSKATEAQKLATAAVDASRDVLLAVDVEKIDVAKAKEALTKSEAAAEALRKVGDDAKDKQEPFSRILVPSLDVFNKNVKELLEKPSLTRATPTAMLDVITFFTRILESNQRALTRSSADGAEGPGMLRDGRSLRPKLPEGHP